MSAVTKHRGKAGVAGGFATGVIAATLFIQAYGATAVFEGGYVNHADDPGGATNHGITEQVARAHGWRGSMRDLPADSAHAWAYSDYWEPLELDEIGEFAPRTARRAYDIGFNAGTGRSAEWMQRCVNSLNKRGSLYRDIAVDRSVGPRTTQAVRSLVDYRGEDGDLALETCMMGLRITHFLTLSERSAQFESFTFGWYLRSRNLPTAP